MGDPAVRSPACTSAALLVALALATRAGSAYAIDWPSPTATPTVRDPLAPLRWPRLPGWIDPSPTRARAVLATLSADDPLTTAWRSVALRALNREDDARDALARATSARPDVLDDPDVALTAAYLAARTHDYANAVALARRALPRLDRDVPRESLVIEVARWSMARGPEGLSVAVAILREWLSYGVNRLYLPNPLVRATLALALARSNRAADLAEATEIARDLAVQHPRLGPTAGDREPLLGGATVLGEGRAAVGVCLLLANTPDSVRASVTPLAYAVASVPAPWREFQSAMLATAHRRAPDAPLPTISDAPPSAAPRRPR